MKLQTNISSRSAHVKIDSKQSGLLLEFQAQSVLELECVSDIKTCYAPGELCNFLPEHLLLATADGFPLGTSLEVHCRETDEPPKLPVSA